MSITWIIKASVVNDLIKHYEHYEKYLQDQKQYNLSKIVGIRVDLESSVLSIVGKVFDRFAHKSVRC